VGSVGSMLDEGFKQSSRFMCSVICVVMIMSPLCLSS
jgi:hypothetical protein